MEVRINGKTTDLSPGFSITMEINNPAFSFSESRGVVSFPVTFPFTDANEQIFGSRKHRAVKIADGNRFDFDLFDSGLLFSGIFKLTDIKKDGYQGSFFTELGAFAQSIQNKKIRDLDLGVVNLETQVINSSDEYINIILPSGTDIENNPGKYQITFYASFDGGATYSQINETTVKIASTLSDALNEFEGKTNIWLIDNNKPVRMKVFGDSIVLDWTFDSEFPTFVGFTDLYPAGGGFPIVTRFFFHTFSYTVPASGLNNNADVEYENKFALPLHENPGLYSDTKSGFITTVNFYDIAGFRYNNPANPKRYSYVPMIFLKTVLEKIFEQYQVSGSFWNDTALRDLLLYSMQTIDNPDPTLPALNAMKSSFTIAGQLPDLGVGELLNEIRKNFCIGYFFSFTGKKLKVEFLKDVLSAPCTIDWTGKLSPDYEQQFEPEKIYKLSFDLDSSDATTKDSSNAIVSELDAITYGTSADNETEEITAKISSFVSSVLVGRREFSTSQPGISPFYEQQKNTFTPRFIFWNGLRENSLSAGLYYPEGYTTDRNNTYDLRWKGEKGLFNKFWKKWIDFLFGSRRVIFKGTLEKADLLSLDTSKKFHYASQDYLIEKIEITFPITSSCRIYARQF